MTQLLAGVQRKIVLEVLCETKREMTVAEIRNARPKDLVLGTILRDVDRLASEGFVEQVAESVPVAYILTEAGRQHLARLG